jgi:hypothetical protein
MSATKHIMGARPGVAMDPQNIIRAPHALPFYALWTVTPEMTFFLPQGRLPTSVAARRAGHYLKQIPTIPRTPHAVRLWLIPWSQMTPS